MRDLGGFSFSKGKHYISKRYGVFTEEIFEIKRTTERVIRKYLSSGWPDIKEDYQTRKLIEKQKRLKVKFEKRSSESTGHREYFHYENYRRNTPASLAHHWLG
jgi:hypothetical protein